MSLLAMLILGGLVGWIAAAVMGRDEGVIVSIIIGIIGSIIGGFVSTLFTGGDQAVLAFSMSGLFWSFIGAVILVALLNAFQGSHRHSAGHL
jgi:uncharacterized membrane protein YeaQ/YmgE (transglycosylase-associated protein family)